MSEHAILTAIGSDRPGLVEEVSAFIFDRGGNIEDSRMVNLRGEFAIMLLVGSTREALGRVRSGLMDLEKKTGLQCALRDAAGAGRGQGQSLPYRLRATALDQSGLVHRLASLLRSMQVNIESMETQLTAAPYTGAPMFAMEMVLTVPQGVGIGGLKKRLGELCDELNIDWEMESGR